MTEMGFFVLGFTVCLAILMVSRRKRSKSF